MAADFILIDRNKQQGNQAVRLANLVQEASDLAENLNEIGQHQFDGSDYTVLEAQFGLQAGAGANFLTLLGLTKDALNAAVLKEFTARVAHQ